MAKKKAATAKAGDEPVIVLEDEDHDAEGNIRPEVQERVNEEQRQLMAKFKAVRDEEEKAERANHQAKLDRAVAKAVKRLDLESVVADLAKRVTALEGAK